MLKDRVEEIVKNTKGTKLKSDIVFDSGFIKIYKEQYKLPDNRIIEKQRIVKNNGKDAAIVVTRTKDDKYLLVFQNRVDNIVSAEFPSGYIEENEDVIDGALRELKEETGYSSKDAKILDSCIASIGTESTKLYIVFVDNAEKEFNQDLDEDEYINYELFTYLELEELINNHFIQGTSNRLAFHLLKEIIKK